MGGGKKKQVIGFEYAMTLHMGICRGPVNEIMEIDVGGKVAWSYAVSPSNVPVWDDGTHNDLAFYTTGATVDIQRADLFGGHAREGGIRGPVMVYFGNPEQTPSTNPFLAANWSGPKPEYRGTVTAWYDGLIATNNPYPKKWSFRVRRSTMGWDSTVFRPDLARINLMSTHYNPYPGIRWERMPGIKAMNPAHIIYESLTNRVWGRGLPSAMLDVDSFEDAAQALYDEAFGLCIRWTRTDEISLFVQHILDHIGGVLFVKRSTGLLTLRLIRGGYDPLALPLYDTSNGILEIVDATVASPVSTTNEVVIEYKDPVTNTARTVRVASLGSIQQTGGVLHTAKREYRGIPTAGIAQRVAIRDLRAMSDGLRKFIIKFDRRVWDIEPGGLVRIQDESRGILPTVLRVGKIEDGTLQSGTITLHCAQDVFALPSGSFISDQESVWEPPITTPCAPDQTVFEVPYVMLARALGPTEMGSLIEESAFLGTIVERGATSNTMYDIAVRGGAPEVEDWPEGDDMFCGYVRPPGAPGG